MYIGLNMDFLWLWNKGTQASLDLPTEEVDIMYAILISNIFFIFLCLWVHYVSRETADNDNDSLAADETGIITWGLYSRASKKEHELSKLEGKLTDLYTYWVA